MTLGVAVATDGFFVLGFFVLVVGVLHVLGRRLSRRAGGAVEGSDGWIAAGWAAAALVLAVLALVTTIAVIP